MPRRKRTRWIAEHPRITGFIPQGAPEAGETALSFEEFEAVRLSDYQGYDQAEAAIRMNISRQTFGRILRQARYTVSEALVTGKRLAVQGGCYARKDMGRGVGTDSNPMNSKEETMAQQPTDKQPSPDTDKVPGQSQGRGQGRGQGQGCGRSSGRGQGRGLSQGLGNGSCRRKGTN